MHSFYDSDHKKTALILCDGIEPSVQMLKDQADQADYVICCDAAIRYAQKSGIKVDIMLGDFDSLGSENLHRIAKQMDTQYKQWPEQKDSSDSQIAAEFAIEKGYQSLIFLGALGGRFDHAMANALSLVFCKQQGADALIMDEKNRIYATCTHRFIKGNIGDYLSIIPLSVTTQIRCTTGLKYPLYDKNLQLGSSFTLSNQFMEKEAFVEVAHGWILLIRSSDSALIDE